MRIHFIGAADFIGQLVANELLNDPPHTVTLTDVIQPPVPSGVRYPQNATTEKADLYTSASAVVTKNLDAALIFHGIMSSGSEANHEFGMRVNVDTTRILLDK